MRSVLAQTYIAGDVQGWEERPELLDGKDDRTIGVIRKSTSAILHCSYQRGKNRELAGTHLFAIDRYAEKNDTLESLLHQWADEFLQSFHAPTALAWEGGNLNTCFGIVRDEDGIHEH
jgi:hypothetical protein